MITEQAREFADRLCGNDPQYCCCNGIHGREELAEAIDELLTSLTNQPAKRTNEPDKV